jgi:hypothetical protein
MAKLAGAGGGGRAESVLALHKTGRRERLVPLPGPPLGIRHPAVDPLLLRSQPRDTQLSWARHISWQCRRGFSTTTVGSEAGGAEVKERKNRFII